MDTTRKKRIIITGATSGIGKALADIYIKRGYTVGLAARREEILRTIAARKPDVGYAVCDVCAPDCGVPALQKLADSMGHVDIILHCSGIGKMNASLDFAEELPTIETNVRGWTAVMDWAFRLFEQQGHGHLAAISSIASLRGLAPAPAYSASKAYQAHYLEALQQRAYGFNRTDKAVSGGISVTNIRPGFVRTPLLNNPDVFFWVVPVEKAAHQIARVMDRRQATATVTRRWKLLVPLMKAAPNRLIAMILSSTAHQRSK